MTDKDAFGLFLLDKECGPTSAQVLRDITKIIGKKTKLGHAGTLDPDGTGLLVALIGDATRLSETIMEMPKRYRATVRFGVTTDTYDAAGKVTGEKDISGLTREAILGILDSFRGKIRQTPPPFSAVKVKGKRSYELARQGIVPELKERDAWVYELELLSFELPEAEFLVKCGKGMYLRSLAHDMGERLGVGAHVKTLRREAVGNLEPRVKVSDITVENWQEKLTNPAEAFPKEDVFILNRRGALNLRRGLPVVAGDFLARPQGSVGKKTAVLDENGGIVAVATIGHGGTILERKILRAL